MTAVRTILALLVGLSPIVFFMLLFAWLRRSARNLKPRQLGAAIEFYVSPRMRILLWIVNSALAAFAALCLLVTLSQGGDGWYAAFIPLVVLLTIILVMPRTVIVDDTGVRQHRWIRQDREIAWNEIAWMRRGVNSNTTYVKSKSGGRPISFSPLLVGQSRFEHEVRARAKGCDVLEDEQE